MMPEGCDVPYIPCMGWTLSVSLDGWMGTAERSLTTGFEGELGALCVFLYVWL